MSAQHNTQQFVPHVHSVGDTVDADADATGMYGHYSRAHAWYTRVVARKFTKQKISNK